jgi:Subtilase family
VYVHACSNLTLRLLTGVVLCFSVCFFFFSCAGIVGALDNKIGVVGVRPGVRVVPLKALDQDGSGGFAGIIAAVEWVARHGKEGDVCNMSLGGGYYQPLDDAVRAVSTNSKPYTIVPFLFRPLTRFSHFHNVECCYPSTGCQQEDLVRRGIRQ